MLCGLIIQCERYTCETCKKAKKLQEHIDTLVSSDDKEECIKAMHELDAMYDNTEVYPQYTVDTLL
jgi:hypothetical protein